MPIEIHNYDLPLGKGTKDGEAGFLEFQKEAIEK